MINYAKLQEVLQEKINQLDSTAQPIDGVQLLTLSRAAEKLKDNSLMVVANVTERNALVQGITPGMLVWVESLNQLQFYGTNNVWAPVFNETAASAVGKAATQVTTLRQTVIGQTQSQINLLEAETAQDNHTLLLALAVDNLTSDRMSFVSTFDDLPNLVENDIGNGLVVYVAERQVHLVSYNQRWLGLDGRVLKDDGGRVSAWGWGANNVGQLGINTIVNVSSPVQTSGQLDTWRYISSGDDHVLAVDSAYRLWAWGNGGNGRLGLGNTVSRSSPVQLTHTSNARWQTVSAGATHTLSVRTDGSLWAWGNGADGRLGLNSTTQQTLPSKIISDSVWDHASAGYAHSAAIDANGSLWAWGSNGGGRLGDGTVVSRSSPVQVGGSGEWKLVSAGGFATSAIKKTGTLWSWGTGSFGALGIGSIADAIVPTQVGTDSDWDTVALGRHHSAAIKSNGSLWMWGRNTHGRLGINNGINQTAPVQVSGGGLWQDVSPGYSHCAAIKTDGTAWAWGQGFQGRLGNNSEVPRSSPVQIAGSSTIWTRVTSGNAHVSGLQTDTSFAP